VPRLKAPHIGKKTRDRPNFGPGLNAHRLVAEQAIEMAQELFEVYARENSIYRALRANGQVSAKQARLVFIERVAPRLLEDARQALTACLSQPDDMVPVSLKDQIAEALILDSPLRASRLVAADQATIPSYLH
jgi:hypothetical protein